MIQYRYSRDAFFATSLETLLKTTDKKELEIASKELTSYVISNNNPMLAYRLAFELDDRSIRTTKLQNFIIDSGDARYIYRFARDIKRANIKKLQDAIMRYGNILQITTFGCFIRAAHKSSIEDLIVKSKNAKSAYLYIKFVKTANINKLKPIILRSRRPRYLYALAKVIKNKTELDTIQDLIASGTSMLYIRLFAQHIKGADIRKLEDAVIATKNITEMKRFAKAVKSPRLEKLALLF